MSWGAGEEHTPLPATSVPRENGAKAETPLGVPPKLSLGAALPAGLQVPLG